MSSSSFSRSFAFVCGVVALMAQTSRAADQLVNQSPDGQALVSSQFITSAPSVQTEAADDFTLQGVVERVVARGWNTGSCMSSVTGVHVRFYDAAGDAPGPLLQTFFVPAGDPDFVYEPCAETLDVTLPATFEATGKHFVSVQLETSAPDSWRWWTANTGNASGSSALQRDVAAGEPWTALSPAADLALEVWGIGPPPPPATTKLWSQLKFFLGDGVPTTTWPSPLKNVEAADDFDVFGSIERIFVGTTVCFPCPYPDVVGAWVRFYEWDAGNPGVLQHEQFISLPSSISSLGVDLILNEPFLATGRHFLSVQLVSTNTHGWTWVEADDPPQMSSVRFRDNLAGGEWGPYLVNGAPWNVDVSFDLWGKNFTPPPTPQGDPCGEWEALDTPIPAGSNHTILDDIAVIADDDVWAVGRQNVEVSPSQWVIRPLVMHWDGSAWSQVSTPVGTTLPFGGAWLEAIGVVAPDDLWVCGLRELVGPGGFVGYDVFIMNWDGSSWEVQDVFVNLPGIQTSNTIGIEIIAADDIWFLGNGASQGCNPALALHYDGSNFTIESTPCPPACGSGGLGGYALEAASAIASDDVWAVGGGTGFAHSICSYVIHWNGSSWSLVPSPEPGITRRLYDVAAIAPDDVWAVGEFFDSLGYHSYAIHWDGSSWTTETLVTGGRDLHVFAPDDIYAVGGGVMHWDGTEWTFVEDFGQGAGLKDGVSLQGVDAIDECRLYVAGREFSFEEIVPFTARQSGGGPWVAVGAGLAGAAGVPSLEGAGELEAGSLATLALNGAAASASTALVIGASELSATFKGGVLVPTPDVLIFGLATDAAGQLTLQAAWPAGLPGRTQVFFQEWIVDAAAVHGWSSSNGLRATTP